MAKTGPAQEEIRDDAARESLVELLFFMRLAREWDCRFENLLLTGGLGKWYSSVGNEAITVGAAAALEPGDGLVTLHRDVGGLFAGEIDGKALLADLLDPQSPPECDGEPVGTARKYLYRLACQMLGRAEGFTGGFDRSYHFGRIGTGRGLVHVGMISHLGAMIPVAAGLALAQSFRTGSESDRSGVTINFIGEGGTSTGDFHEGLNMAAVWKLPLVLIVENNHYAYSTPEKQQYACASLADRGPGYGIPACTVDGNDVLQVRAAVRDAVERSRRGEGPTLIEARVGRLRGHAEGDGSLTVVAAAEMQAYRERDPVPCFEKTLIDDGVIDAAVVEVMNERIRALLVDIIDRACEAALPEPVTALASRSVFVPSVEVVESIDADPLTGSASGERKETTYLEAISRALREEMRQDDAVILLGQDIAEFGGAFRVTAGLLEEFGSERVRNTPVAESGTLGIAAGAALMGLRPVVEMQFADFVSCAFNQLVNVVAKMYFRWQGEVPLVVRCPAGGGAGAGPFHAQNPEAWFAHAPGLKIMVPAFARDALGLLKTAIRDPGPVLFFEHKHLYRRIREPLPDGEVLVPPGRAVVRRPGTDVTAVAYGWMVHRALEAAERLAMENVSVEVIDLRSLVPLDMDTVLDSVRRTSKVAVIHEATRTCGIGAEIAARVAAEAFDALDGPVERITCPDIPVPFQADLEAACIPDVERIARELKALVKY